MLCASMLCAALAMCLMTWPSMKRHSKTSTSRCRSRSGCSATSTQKRPTLCTTLPWYTESRGSTILRQSVSTNAWSSTRKCTAMSTAKLLMHGRKQQGLIPKVWAQWAQTWLWPTLCLEATLLLTTARLCLEHQCCSCLGWVLGCSDMAARN